MPSPAPQRATENPSPSANLFSEADAETLTARPGPAAGGAGRHRRGRGLVVAVDDHSPRPSESGAARFTRASSGPNAIPAIARRRAARADRNAQRLLQRIAAQHHGALIALLAVAALLLLVGWLGLSLRAANRDRDHLRDQRATATRALTAARAQTRAVSAQRDQARRATTAAHTGQVLAQGSRRTWKQRAERAQRQLTATRKAAKDAKHKG